MNPLLSRVLIGLSVLFPVALLDAKAKDTDAEGSAPVIRQIPGGTLYTSNKANADIAAREMTAVMRAAKTYYGMSVDDLVVVENTVTPDQVASHHYPGFQWVFSPEKDPRIQRRNFQLRHEIGHEFFISNFIGRTKPDIYGGDAPDWLDETAAIVFEDEAETQERRHIAVAHFTRGTHIPLRKFLSMLHPQHTASSVGNRFATAFRQGTIRDQQDYILTGTEAEQTILFYAQCRVFFDFLSKTTDNPQVLKDIAESLMVGKTMDEWLIAKIYPVLDVKSLDALEARFIDWVITVELTFTP